MQSVSCHCIVYVTVGEKKNDPLSPAYVPSLFSFTPSLKRKIAEQSMNRYTASKRRKEAKVRNEAVGNTECDVDQPNDLEPEEYQPDMKCSGTQTDLSASDLLAIEDDYKKRLEELSELRTRHGKAYPEQEDLKNDEKMCRFYTGLSSYTVLIALFQIVSSAIHESPVAKLTHFQCFTLTVMKLRLNLNNFDLACRFGVSEATVSRVFSRWIEAMDTRLSFLIKWPDRESLQRTMPFCFRCNYGLKVTSIIDCFEIFIERPSNLLAKNCTWSQYKHYNTAKYLISITPQGFISFISDGWGGKISDKYIVENSGYLKHLLPGDVVLADRGFDVADSVALYGATLDIPAFTRGCNQLGASEVEATRKLANVRIHVERVIGAMRQRFQILSATGVLQKEMYSQKLNDGVVLDAVVRICCSLHNACEGVVPFS